MLPKKFLSIYIFLFFVCLVTLFNDGEINLFVFSRTTSVVDQNNSEIYALVRSGVAAAMSGNDRQFRFLIIQLFTSTYKLSLFQIVVFNEVLQLIKNKKLEFQSRSEVHELIAQLTNLLTLDVKDPKESRPIIRKIFQEIKETYKIQNRKSKRSSVASRKSKQRKSESESTTDSATPHTQVDQFPSSATPIVNERNHIPREAIPVSPSVPSKDSSQTETQTQAQTDKQSGEPLSVQSLQEQREESTEEEIIIGCQSASDRAILYENADKSRNGNDTMKPRNKFYDYLLSCSLSNFGASEATINCVKKRLESDNKNLSDQCLRCFKESVQCGRSNCTFSCMFSSACGDTCFNCGVKYCQDNLKTCTGLSDLPSACV